MTSWVFPLIVFSTKWAKARFVRKTRRVAQTQEQVLLSLLRAYETTELGQRLGLSQIQTVDQFRAQIPVQDYRGYQPYTERIAQGETRVLTPDPVIYLNLSSGSTGPKKLIPITRRFQKSLQRANQASIGFAIAALEARGLRLGKLLVTSSARSLGKTEAGIPYGYASVRDLQMGKFLYQRILAHPYEALQIQDSLARHYICLLFALRDRSLGGITATFPLMVLQICRYLEKHAEALIHDLETGTIAPWLPLEPALRSHLAQQWSADPQRAAELRQVLEQRGRLTPKAVWPQLSLVATARGGTSDFYFERFSDYFADTPIFGGIYAASEATFGICHALDQNAAILALESGFFEFIPIDQWDQEQPPTLLATEVKVGEFYRIVVTNFSGFYRYDLGDVVEVVGFYHQAPLIVFRHRRGGLLSATSEKTTEFHVNQVMERLQSQFDLSLEDFCITLSEAGIPPHYLVNIELAAPSDLQDPQAFLARFDHLLQEVNLSYGLKRQDHQISPPWLRILAPGSFASLRLRQIRRGTPEAHLKIPHLSEDRQFLADLTVIQEVRLLEDQP